MYDKPNILIIMSDQHGPHFSGPYGHPLIKTPNLDRLAENGVTFDNAYTTCPVCVPARMSFMTGRYIQHIGIWDNGAPLAEDESTWAHHLRKAGYEVVISGKMHFRGHDQLHGFERQLAFDMNSLNSPIPPDWSKPAPKAKHPLQNIRRGPGRNAVIESDDVCVERAVEYLAQSQRHERPWALNVGFVLPHPPFKAPQKYYDQYPLDQIDLPNLPEGHLSELHPFHQRYFARVGVQPGYPPEQVIRETRATYYGMVTYMDMLIGKLIQVLETTGQSENTAIIYLSDHGEMMGEHGRWGKMCFFEQAARIPLIISYPFTMLKGIRCNDIVSTVDVTSTILDLAGILSDLPDFIHPDGESLRPLLQQPDARKTSGMISELYHEYTTSAPTAMYREGRYKFNYYHGEAPELFDLEADPKEMHNLASSAEYQHVIEDMRHKLLTQWDPEEIEQRVRRSQAHRHYLKPYLFGYIEAERRKLEPKFLESKNP